MKFSLSLQKLAPKPKDIIVITVKQDLTEKGFLTVKNQIRGFLEGANYHNKVLILQPGFAISAKSIDQIKSDLDAIRS